MNRISSLFLQLLLILFVVVAVGFFCHNAVHNLQVNHIASGFGFLEKPTDFDIVMSLIPYSPESTYLRAFIVGILNTILLSVLAIIFASVIGFLIGISRISSNWLVAHASLIYIELFRNIPLLLQILFWYFILLRYLPPPYASWQIFHGVSLNVRGLQFGTISVIPELIAMLIALTLYSASYIAENVRGGLKSVDRGQFEAAQSLGLRHWQILRFIVIPQAWRVIIPPLTSQYLNIIKNSSLSAVIGYPDLVAVFAGTALNQTGQAVEIIFMVMSVYLIISLIISMFMNWYNRRVMMVLK